MNFKIFTLFPEFFPNAINFSIFKKALNKSLWKMDLYNIRDYAENSRVVDDTPYGGGSGMLLKPEPIAKAIDQNIKEPKTTKIIYPSPRGRVFNQRVAENLAQNYQEISIICGRYEGIDQRVIDEYQMDEISIGNYIISGGELAAAVIMDGVLRNIEGILGDKNSLDEESFGKGYNSEFSNLLEYPQYTKPRIWKNREVPEILTSGNHAQIKRWKMDNSILTQDHKKIKQ
jgi:tRNA (guanine37-N1)-methyltransferase